MSANKSTTGARSPPPPSQNSVQPSTAATARPLTTTSGQTTGAQPAHTGTVASQNPLVSIDDLGPGAWTSGGWGLPRVDDPAVVALSGGFYEPEPKK